MILGSAQALFELLVFLLGFGGLALVCVGVAGCGTGLNRLDKMKIALGRQWGQLGGEGGQWYIEGEALAGLIRIALGSVLFIIGVGLLAWALHQSSKEGAKGKSADPQAEASSTTSSGTSTTGSTGASDPTTTGDSSTGGSSS